jgi:hypothetical protein
MIELSPHELMKQAPSTVGFYFTESLKLIESSLVLDDSDLSTQQKYDFAIRLASLCAADFNTSMYAVMSQRF